MLVLELRIHVDRLDLRELDAGGSCLINTAFLSTIRFAKSSALLSLHCGRNTNKLFI